jgi:retinaldehyde-binding protein 1
MKLVLIINETIISRIEKIIILILLKKLKNYLRMMKNYPELFTDLRPGRVKHVFDLGHLLASPLRDQNGCRVFIINARNFS